MDDPASFCLRPENLSLMEFKGIEFIGLRDSPDTIDVSDQCWESRCNANEIRTIEERPPCYGESRKDFLKTKRYTSKVPTCEKKLSENGELELRLGLSSQVPTPPKIVFPKGWRTEADTHACVPWGPGSISSCEWQLGSFVQCYWSGRYKRWKTVPWFQRATETWQCVAESGFLQGSLLRPLNVMKVEPKLQWKLRDIYQRCQYCGASVKDSSSIEWSQFKREAMRAVDRAAEVG